MPLDNRNQLRKNSSGSFNTDDGKIGAGGYTVMKPSMSSIRKSRSQFSGYNSTGKSTDHIRCISCVVFMIICLILFIGWEINSLKQELQTAAAIETLSQLEAAENLLKPSMLEQDFEKHLKTHLVEQKQNLRAKLKTNNEKLKKSKGPQIDKEDFNKENLKLESPPIELESKITFLESESLETDPMKENIEEKLQLYKQRLKDGSAPLRVSSKYEQVKEEKKNKKIQDAFLAQTLEMNKAREEAEAEKQAEEEEELKLEKEREERRKADVEEERTKKKNKSIKEKRKKVKTNKENSDVKTKKKDLEGTLSSSKSLIHCADLKRGICSVVSCEQQLCYCEGCPLHFLDHCCDVTETGLMTPKVGPRIPLRVSH